MNLEITTETLRESREFCRNLITDSFLVKNYLSKQEPSVLSQYVPSFESVTILTKTPVDDNLLQDLYKPK